jgi:hypothetical protein
MCWCTYPHEWRDLWRFFSSRSNLACHQIAGSGSNESRRQTLMGKPCKGTAKEPLWQSSRKDRKCSPKRQKLHKPWIKQVSCRLRDKPQFKTYKWIACLTNKKEK